MFVLRWLWNDESPKTNGTGSRQRLPTEDDDDITITVEFHLSGQADIFHLGFAVVLRFYFYFVLSYFSFIELFFAGEQLFVLEYSRSLSNFF